MLRRQLRRRLRPKAPRHCRRSNPPLRGVLAAAPSRRPQPYSRSCWTSPTHRTDHGCRRHRRRLMNSKRLLKRLRHRPFQRCRRRRRRDWRLLQRRVGRRRIPRRKPRQALRRASSQPRPARHRCAWRPPPRPGATAPPRLRPCRCALRRTKMGPSRRRKPERRRTSHHPCPRPRRPPRHFDTSWTPRPGHRRSRRGCRNNMPECCSTGTRRRRRAPCRQQAAQRPPSPTGDAGRRHRAAGIDFRARALARAPNGARAPQPRPALALAMRALPWSANA
mmetsp:Transcript_892/g.2847  ORF Transcript_892/g.2847 Transcript_892/m.2847 type:complete len:278 (+) Transcript_892:223-1056(+)